MTNNLSSRIIFEDNHLIIVNKLPSEIVQGDKTGDMPLSEYVKEYLKEKYNKPGNVFLGVVHRLDRPVSGAVIFARTGKALTRMNEMLKNREIRKIYWAIVSKKSAVSGRRSEDNSRRSTVSGQQSALHPSEDLKLETSNLKPETGDQTSSENNPVHLVHYLRRIEAPNISYAYFTIRHDAQRAELTYKVIANSDRYHLLEVELLTGRHHQIRAQLAAIGFPVKGDLKYGFPRSNPDGSIHLHSRRLEFMHPVKKEIINVIAPPPKERLWDFFTGILPSY